MCMQRIQYLWHVLAPKANTEMLSAILRLVVVGRAWEEKNALLFHQLGTPGLCKDSIPQHMRSHSWLQRSQNPKDKTKAYINHVQTSYAFMTLVWCICLQAHLSTPR